MNLRDLAYISAVATHKHFGRAAEACFVSQPTLSGQIRKLEQELGVALFERTSRSVDLTPAGEAVIAQARQVLEGTENIRSIAESFQRPMAGPLRVGTIPTLSPYLMPLILSPLRERFPEARLAFTEDTTASLLERLHQHELDLLLLATEENDADSSQIALFDEPFWVAYNRDHEFYHQASVSTADLETENLLLLAEGHCLADQAMSVCGLKSRGNTPAGANVEATSLETLLQLVAAGFGVTLVPALAMRGSWASGSGVVAQPLDDSGAYRRVYLTTRQSFPRQQALSLFGQLIVEHLPNTVTPLLKPD